jgi:hypothetical protein
MHLHALNDDVVFYEGGAYFPSVESVIDIWVGINGCETDPDTTTSTSTLMVRKWAAISHNADVVLFTTPTGGHSWLTSIPATDSIWAFFEAHPLDPATGVDDNYNPDAVKNLTLKQNYPNPSNTATTICFSVPNREKVTLKIFDLLGNEIATLLDEEISAGEHRIVFELKNLPTGVYFYRIQAGKSIDEKKLVILK